ncbi:hypothetical protein FQZ97_899650 [compost metagenome]
MLISVKTDIRTESVCFNRTAALQLEMHFYGFKVAFKIQKNTTGQGNISVADMHPLKINLFVLAFSSGKLHTDHAFGDPPVFCRKQLRVHLFHNDIRIVQFHYHK